MFNSATLLISVVDKRRLITKLNSMNEVSLPSPCNRKLPTPPLNTKRQSKGTYLKAPEGVENSPPDREKKSEMEAGVDGSEDELIVKHLYEDIPT